VSWSKKQPEKLVAETEKVLEKPNYEAAKAFTNELVEKFAKEKSYDAIYVAFSEFRSAISQNPKIVRFLPVAMEEKQMDLSASGDFYVEPSLEQIIDNLLTQKLTGILFQAFLEGAASEHGGRMSAMDSATNNAGEVRRKLTLEYNRARQASITSELIEIISGAEAL
jgi:F-type H+-transporting ATPase subunit gamma